MNKIPQRLKELRNEKNLTQKQLANIIDVTQACIANWELGDREPSIDDLIKIAKFFSVTLDYLVGLED